MPYFDSSGWFLIEKTTILTNSCCLYVQPTFGYLKRIHLSNVSNGSEKCDFIRFIIQAEIIRFWFDSWINLESFTSLPSFTCGDAQWLTATVWAALHSPPAGGSDPTPLAISKTVGFRDMGEATFERSRWNASKTFAKIENWGHVWGQGQIKAQNQGMQVAEHRDLRLSSFRPKFSICTPKNQARVLKEWTFSYLAQVKVKVRSKRSANSKFSNESCDTCFMVNFGRRTRQSRFFKNLTSFEPKNKIKKVNFSNQKGQKA